MLDLAELEHQARERLDRGAYDFFAGGADDELTVAADPVAWARLRLRPRGLLAPNEGMRRSRRNAVVGGVPFAIPFGVLTAVLYGTQLGGAQFGAITGLHTMLPIWVLAGLWAGGRAYLRHLAVRALLWRTGRAPWGYVAFLDDATDHLILQRVGRGYQFVHALLLDHFANLNQASDTSPRASATCRSVGFMGL